MTTTKTLATAAVALLINTGAAFANSGYADYHYAPGASDYSHTQLVAEDGRIVATGAQVAFDGAPRQSTGSARVANNEPAVIFAGGATGNVRNPDGGYVGQNVAEAR